MSRFLRKLSTLLRLIETSLALSRSVTERKSSLKDFCKKYSHLTDGMQEEISLDLGCGNNPQNPFNFSDLRGIDLSSNTSNVLNVDISRHPIPFPDDSVAVITAFHFIEHIPRVSSDANHKFPFIHLMNEIHRVLKNGGYFLSVTPAFPFQSSFSDPTHVNFITEKTFKYYFASSCVNSSPMSRISGFTGNFTCISQAWDGDILISLLQKN